MAMAPPRTFTFSGSALSSLITASAWAAKASLSSIRSMSASFSPARSSALCVGRHRADAHHRRIDAGHRHGADADLGLQAQLPRPLLRHDQQGGGADVERAGVAGRHGAALGHERRLQRGQGFQAGIAADALVLGMIFLRRPSSSRPQVGMISRAKAPLSVAGGRQAVAAQGELVLLLAADLVAQGQVLRGQAHVHDGGAVAIEEARAGIEAGLHGDVVHVLDAAGDLHVLAAGGDALGRLVDGLQAASRTVRLTVAPPTSIGKPAIRAAMRAMS